MGTGTVSTGENLGTKHEQTHQTVSTLKEAPRPGSLRQPRSASTVKGHQGTRGLVSRGHGSRDEEDAWA